MSVVVRRAAETDAASWDRFVGSRAETTSYQRWAWGNLLASEFRLPWRPLAAFAGGEVVGVLPLIAQSNPLLGRRLLSLPFVNYAGLAAADDEARDALLAAAADALRAEGARFAELRQPPEAPLPLPASSAKIRARLPLPAAADELWGRLGAKLRSQVKRPTKEGMTASVGGAELVPEFHRLLARKWREHGSPIYREAFFRRLAATFPDETSLVVVRRGGDAVAAGWLHRRRGVAEMVWAASDRRFDGASPNMLLYWCALARAIEDGCTVFDFGRSTAGGGTHRFKLQWGAVSEPLPWYYVLGAGARVPDGGEGAGARLVKAAWRRLPLAATRIIGPYVARTLPL